MSSRWSWTEAVPTRAVYHERGAAVELVVSRGVGEVGEAIPPAIARRLAAAAGGRVARSARAGLRRDAAERDRVSRRRAGRADGRPSGRAGGAGPAGLGAMARGRGARRRASA